MTIIPYTVHPNLPEPLRPLEELAHDVWVTWNYDAIMLFTRLDYGAWIQSGQNPVRALGMVPQERLETLAQDDSYRSALQRVVEKYERYKNGETWFHGDRKNVVAYFSMEYGLDVSLPIYSGGLGVLAGDHLKTSSDLGLPLVAVGLLYRQGYFRQYLSADGYQQESYPENDWYNMPVRRCQTKGGEDVKITVDMAGSVVTARIWEVRVGRVSLYLLDTNIDENSDAEKLITATLYGGNREMRLRQEILLGIGGVRALRAVGINPAVTHMNEGHSAFLGIERIRELMTGEGLSLDEAIQALWPTNVFTTHTPVPAGNERFSVELMQKYFPSITAGTEMSWYDFMALGRENPDDQQEHFCLTVLALKLSAYNNAVSELHGEVSRDMWKNLWPELPNQEVPIRHITNGVHARSFMSHDMTELLDRYFGPRFHDEPTFLDVWDRIDRVSDEEIWRMHERQKSRLAAFARERLRSQLETRGASASELHHAEEVLSPGALTISFARRFATYKRGNLLFRDPERLMKLLTDTERPIQLIFAGKAHPHDVPGKNLIKEIVKFASQPEVRSRVLFLENYDIGVARYLVSGSDLWLNTPRRPMEASGTSGMKAAINGVLNCSVLDGWWAEAYSPEIGWAIGRGEVYEDEELQDEIESEALYDLLEREIIPTYYDRGMDGLPREWIRKMKASVREVGKRFSCHRMIMEYHNDFYEPALKNYGRMKKNGYAAAKDLSEYMWRLRGAWDSVRILHVKSPESSSLRVGDKLTVEAVIDLAGLSPQDVSVEVYAGHYGSKGEIEDATRAEMKAKGNGAVPAEASAGGTASAGGAESGDGEGAPEAGATGAGDAASSGATGVRYVADITCNQAGRQAFSVRVLPRHKHLAHNYIPGLTQWA